MHTKEYLKSQLLEMGLKPTDTVMIHTSLRAVGKTENGADGVIDAFCEVLSDGLFLVPTHTWNSVHKNQPVFDVNKTVPCIGALPTRPHFKLHLSRKPSRPVFRVVRSVDRHVDGHGVSTASCRFTDVTHQSIVPV